jgi:hypothetical protein
MKDFTIHPYGINLKMKIFKYLKNKIFKKKIIILDKKGKIYEVK